MDVAVRVRPLEHHGWTEITPKCPEGVPRQWFAARYAETCSKSSFWQQMKKKSKRFIFGRRPLFLATKRIKKTVGGKSIFAGNAGFSISGSRSLAHPLSAHRALTPTPHLVQPFSYCTPLSTSSNFTSTFSSAFAGLALDCSYLPSHLQFAPKSFSSVYLRCQQSMLSKKWLGAECTQYSELSVIILGEPPPSET